MKGRSVNLLTGGEWPETERELRRKNRMGWKDAKGGSAMYLFPQDKVPLEHTVVIVGDAEVVESAKYKNKRVYVNCAKPADLDKGTAVVMPLNITTGEELATVLHATDAKKSLVGKVWVTIRREGTGIEDTVYTVKAGKKLTPAELKKVKALKLKDLAKVASD